MEFALDIYPCLFGDIKLTVKIFLYDICIYSCVNQAILCVVHVYFINMK